MGPDDPNHQAPEDPGVLTSSPPSDQQGRETRNQREPNEYATAILEYSLRAKHSTLYPGVHYRPLAQLLGASQHRRSVSWHQRQAAERPLLRAHAYAVLHELVFGHGDSRRVSIFDRPQLLSSFAQSRKFQDAGGQLLFLRGNPSPEWIDFVGVQYLVDPEFFRRHLNFAQGRDFYDLPAPPSSSQNIIHLSVTSIGRRNVATPAKEDGLKKLQEYLQNLGTNRAAVGESIVRRFSVHDETHFSIEQQISICVVRRKGGWTAIILCDHGRELDEGPNGPWSSLPSQATRYSNIFIPTIQFLPKIVFKEPPSSHSPRIHPSPSSSPGTDSPMSQSAALLASSSYGRFLSNSTMQSSPFYALHELFTFVLAAESQFINFMAARLEAETTRWTREPEAMESALETLRRHKALLLAHKRQLAVTVRVVRFKGDPGWARFGTGTSGAEKGTGTPSRSPQTQSGIATHGHAVTAQRFPDPQRQDFGFSDASQHGCSARDPHADQAAGQLLQDYEEVLERADALVRVYADGMEDIRNSAMLLESRKAIEQARGVARLTLLAFFFIPLSFTTSFFGMNLRELTTQEQSVGIWFAVSVPVFVIAVGVYFWQQVRHRWEKLWSKVRSPNGQHQHSL